MESSNLPDLPRRRPLVEGIYLLPFGYALRVENLLTSYLDAHRRENTTLWQGAGSEMAQIEDVDRCEISKMPDVQITSAFFIEHNPKEKQK